MSATLLPRGARPSTTLLTTSTRPTTPLVVARKTTTPTASQTLVLPQTHQVRHATEVRRPMRPFKWTQIIQLSDGSTYTTRTTSPLPVYRSTKDTRNHLVWQPSDTTLQNVEVDEAGKLASFRARFGSGFDLEQENKSARVAALAMEASKGARRMGRKEKMLAMARAVKEAEEQVKKEAESAASEENSFMELMAAYKKAEPNLKGGMVAAKTAGKKGKKK